MRFDRRELVPQAGLRGKKESTRDPEKEKYWREILARWKGSRLSQAAFYRLKVLNENSFSS